MKAITLSRGKVTVVDDDQYEALNQYKWHFVATSRTNPDYGFAARWVKSSSGKRILLLMHRALASAPAHLEVDHWNRQPLDNQMHNLRISTRTENNRNSGPRNGSPFKGAKYHKAKRKWEATIYVAGSNQYLGNFDSAEEAAVTYDCAAIQVFGGSAYLNIIGRQS